MLQRIQSLYLVLVVLFAFLFLFFPIGSFRFNGETVAIALAGSNIATENFVGAYASMYRYALYALLLVVVVFTINIIFKYNRRLYQIRMGKINILFHLVLLVLSFFYLDHLRASLPESTLSYGPSIFFPLVSLFLILLANRYILKDEKLVRAADRIR